MDPVRRFSRPTLRSPVALLAWEGWNDACDAASGAAASLLGQYELDPFATIEPEEFYDFQVRRPMVEIDGGGTRKLTWPTTRLFAVEMPDRPYDMVVVIGEEPSLRWKTYTRTITRLLAECDVKLAVTLGALIGRVPHTVPVPIVGFATDPALIEQHRLVASHYEGPTGIISVMLEACREAGIRGVSLWAATPHYLAANPNPSAMLALLRRAALVAGLPFGTDELEAAAADFEARIAEAMTANTDFVGYVERLEGEMAEGVWPSPIAGDDAAQLLVSEIEDFLRDR